MLVWGLWAFEILTFMASYLSPEALAAQSILRALGIFTFMIPVGFSKGTITLIGNALGAEKPALCNQYYKTSLVVATVMATVTVALLWLLEHQIISVFSTLPEIVDYITPAWSVYLIYVLVDAVNVIGASGIRATGNQSKGVWITSLCYWLIGLPLAWVLCFKAHMDLAGLWLGLMVAVVFTIVGYNVLFFRIDWTQ